jgi:hypothetical protein
MTNARVGELSVQTTSARPIVDAEWDQYIENCKAEFAEEGGLPVAVLQYSLVVFPSATQRRELESAQAAFGSYEDIKRVAIITDSALARGAMAAILWLLRLKTQVRGFSRRDVRGALQWLAQVARFSEEEAWRVLNASVQEVGYPPLIDE